jgi:hypothetical protein
MTEPAFNPVLQAQKFCDLLNEHCDSVRIFITLPANDGSGNTQCFSAGSGNFCAQKGQIHEWLIMEDERSRQHMADSLNPPGSDEEPGIIEDL